MTERDLDLMRILIDYKSSIPSCLTLVGSMAYLIALDNLSGDANREEKVIGEYRRLIKEAEEILEKSSEAVAD